ncbi:hypothetical protein D6850_16430 [Roseovarius spongiae]|uniref:Uncharacterized protein n=1 Tax=Roseovarius spongiae TaxID=2320272 RepID=A0A3A8B7V4_9RHOB|nr:hypothetical protein D6850_16430 [Roseovarius spongiae]
MPVAQFFFTLGRYASLNTIFPQFAVVVFDPNKVTRKVDVTDIALNVALWPVFPWHSLDIHSQ